MYISFCKMFTDVLLFLYSYLNLLFNHWSCANECNATSFFSGPTEQTLF